MTSGRDHSLVICIKLKQGDSLSLSNIWTYQFELTLGGVYLTANDQEFEEKISLAHLIGMEIYRTLVFGILKKRFDYSVLLQPLIHTKVEELQERFTYIHIYILCLQICIFKEYLYLKWRSWFSIKFGIVQQHQRYIYSH